MSIQADVTAAFEQAFPKDKIEPSSDFFDLGGDSIALVALCTFLERRMDFEIHPSVLFYHPTVEELATELTAQSKAKKT